LLVSRLSFTMDEIVPGPQIGHDMFESIQWHGSEVLLLSAPALAEPAG
jgi:hypothetical protein